METIKIGRYVVADAAGDGDDDDDDDADDDNDGIDDDASCVVFGTKNAICIRLVEDCFNTLFDIQLISCIRLVCMGSRLESQNTVHQL